MSGVQLPVPENLSQYITSHSGQLSLASGHPYMGMRNVYQPKDGDALRLGLKAGMLREWVTL